MGPAALAGLMADAFTEGPVLLQKALGLPVKQNIFRTWGSCSGSTAQPATSSGSFSTRRWRVAAVLCAVFFNLIGAEGDLWLYGLIGNLIHRIIAGAVVAMIPSLNRRSGTSASRASATTQRNLPTRSPAPSAT